MTVLRDPLDCITLGAIDVAALMAEDVVVVEEGGALRAGVSRPLVLTDAHGQWFHSPGGSTWMAEIACDGAVAHRLTFLDLDLPEGVTLRVFDTATGRVCAEDITGNGPHHTGVAYSGQAYGPVRIEYFWPGRHRPSGSAASLGFVEVGHIYRDISPTGSLAAAEAECHLDRTCFEEWDEVSEAVARVLFLSNGGYYLCTGQMMATTSQDETPYWSTAYHCINSTESAESAEFLFDWETTTCDDEDPQEGETILGSSIVSAYAITDTTLLMIRPVLPLEEDDGIFWVGWTADEIPIGTEATLVHHPGGGYMRLTTGQKTDGPQLCASADWEHIFLEESGAVEGGSSGSGIYVTIDDEHLLYGIASCATTTICDDVSPYTSHGRWDQSVEWGGFDVYMEAGSDDEFEQNDRCSDSRLIGEGTFSNLVVKRVDDDWYRLIVDAGGTLSVRAFFIDGWGDIDLKLYLTCSSDYVASSTSNSNNEDFSWTNISTTAVECVLNVYLHDDVRNEYRLDISGEIAPGGPDNNSCLTAEHVNMGRTEFDTTDAYTIGPLEEDCIVQSDLWYEFEAHQEGYFFIQFSSDDKLFQPVAAVYESCPDEAGDVEECATAANGYLIDLELQEGDVIKIRVGSADGTTGPGEFDIDYVPLKECPWDCALFDREVDTHDILALLDQWGGSGTCDCNDSGTVDLMDLLQILARWGHCP
jgi:hypothetical protein